MSRMEIPSHVFRQGKEQTAQKSAEDKYERSM